MSKHFGFIVVAISLMALAANVTLFLRMGAAEKAIKNFEKLQIALPPELHKKIEEKLVQESGKIVASVALLAKQKIAGNELAAEEAFKTATALMKKGDFTSARLYCLNAINHAPNKKQYFDTLYRIIEANKSTNISELEQLRSVLELGLYQVDSRDIPAMTKMLATVVNKQEKISEKSAKLQSQNEKRQITEAIELLKNGSLAWKAMLKESVEEAIPLLRERLNKLTNLADRVSGNEIEFWNAEIKRSNALLEYSMAMYSINNALEKADRLLKSGKAVPAVNSMVQSANNILGQAWNINFSYIPAECRSKLLGQADRIVILEKKFNEIKSRPAIAKINGIYDDSLNKLEGNCTQKIATLQAGMKQIMAQAAKVYDADKRREIEEKMEVLADKVKEYTKERYEGYQKWATNVCDAVFASYKNEKIVDKDDAKNFINRLKEIEPALLTASVSRLYQDILSKQFAELGWKEIAEMEKMLATERKKTIEDCPNEE